MPRKLQPNLPNLSDLTLPSRIAFGIVTVVLLLFGIILFAQGMIDTRPYREEVARVIRLQTGQDVIIKGPVTISLLPSQTLFVSGIELRDTNNETPGPSLTVGMLRLDIAPLSILSAHPRITGVTLEQPTLEVTRADDGKIRWKWLNPDLLKSLTGKQGPSLALNIKDGKIIYYDNRSSQVTAIDKLSASGEIGPSPSLRGSFGITTHALQFSVDSRLDKGIALAAGAIPMNLKLFTDASNALQLQGGVDFSGDTPKINGKLSVELEDTMAWWSAVKPPEEPVFDPFTIIRKSGSATRDEHHMALKLSGDWAQQGLNIDMTNVQLQGLDSQGTGKLSLGWAGAQPNFISDLHFSTLEFDRWKALAMAVFNKGSSSSNAPYNASFASTDNPLPGNIQMTLNVAADQLKLGAQSWQNAHISANLAESVITVNQLHIELPGEAKLGLFGIISQGGTGGLRFEGSLEAAGKSLRQLLTIFNPAATDLPDTGFNDFSLRSNIFVSPDQMRLSEADARLSDLHLNGGLVAYFDASNPRLEADAHLKDINFDYFRDMWRIRQKAAKTGSFFLQFNKNAKFNWLKKLQSTIDLKVHVDGFTFMERKGDAASFRLFARQNEFGIYDVVLNYPDVSTSGGFRLDVEGEQPYVDVTLNTDVIDMRYFDSDTDSDSALDDDAKKSAAAPKPQAKTANDGSNATAPAASDASAPQDIKWSDKLINMDWMDGFNGEFNFTIGKLLYNKLAINGIKMQARLNHNLLTFQNFNFGFWQARCNVLGSMYGGKVPGLSISYTMSDAEIADVLKTFTHRDNIAGKVNINGTLATSGVNPLSWVQQADAKIIMNGNVRVSGVNIQGVLNAVNVSRTSADVFNNVNRELVKGWTDFQIGGNINVKNGSMQTPGISLRTGTILGNFRADINLVQWNMNSTTLFQFPALPSDTVPTLTVLLTGPFDAPQLRTDTSSLEAYVTGHIKGS